MIKCENRVFVCVHRGYVFIDVHVRVCVCAHMYMSGLASALSSLPSHIIHERKSKRMPSLCLIRPGQHVKCQGSGFHGTMPHGCTEPFAYPKALYNTLDAPYTLRPLTVIPTPCAFDGTGEPHTADLLCLLPTGAELRIRTLRLQCLSQC